MKTQQLALTLVGLLGSLALMSCDLDIPDLNNPGLEQLENAPTVAGINTAATGLLVGNRGGKAGTTGIVNQVGILGREALDFDAADARFVTELIQANLNKSSPFGGVFWAGNYANIRLGNIILRGVDKVAEYKDSEKQGIRGFTHTIQALELLTVIVTHDTTGAVIDTDHPLGEPLGAFVPKDAVYVEIARLLDLAAQELAGAGGAFTFALSPGYAGFSTPTGRATPPDAGFLKVNRAIKARVAAYQASDAKDAAVKTAKYQEALTALSESFIDDASAMVPLRTGVFHVFSLGAGDLTNGLINAAIFAHPTLTTDAQMNGTVVDKRYTDKIAQQMSTTAAPNDPALKSSIKFKIYTNVTPIPVIRNEELILLKAEALWFTGNKAGALAALNVVRTQSGGLLPLVTVPTDDTAFVDALLYERRYSLMFEGGHRWIDLRRFGRALPLDAPTHKANIRFPIPQAECDARVNEPACAINSSDPAP